MYIYIYNQLDITIHEIASQLLVIVTSSAIDCDAIRECNPNEWDTWSKCEDRRFYRHLWIRYVVQEIKLYVLVTNCLFSHSSDILLFISP